MSWFDGWRERVRWITQSRRAEREMHEEMQFHLQMAIAENEAKGMDPAAAREAARKAFGDLGGAKEDVRRQRGIGVIDDALRDLIYAVRGLKNRPGFTLVAAGTLALGVGANTAVFSVVNAIVLQPLDFPRSHELVSVWDGYFSSFRERNFIRDNSTTLQDVASYAPWTVALTDVNEPTQLVAARTSANMFRTLRADAAIGRTFAPDDDRPGAEPVAVLSHGLWRSSFGGDSSVVGRVIRIDGTSHTVIGVMPREFEALRANTQIWIPLPDDQDQWYYEGNMTMLFGRLATQTTPQQATAELQQLTARMRDAHARDDAYGQGATVTGLKESIVGEFGVLLYILLGAVVLILLVAGVNLGNLLVARAQSRMREIGMRSALGASGGRLVRQLLVEGVLITALGCGVGLLFAFGGTRALVAVLPGGTPRLEAVGINGTVLLVCLGFAAVVGLGFSLAPVAKFALGRMRLSLDAGRRATARRGSARVLVATQLAMAVMLVVGAGLMLRTLWNLSAVHPGFVYSNVLTLRVHPAGDRYRDRDAMHAFYRTAMERIRAVPGVKDVGAVQHLPLSGAVWQTDVDVDGFTPAAGAPPVNVGYRIATPGYFSTLLIPVREGRSFSTQDRASADPVVIVNQAFADTYWAGQTALGRTIRRLDDSVAATVVGVVGNARYASLLNDPVPELYLPHEQASMRAMMLAVRTAEDPARAARAVQDAIWSVDADVPVSRVVSMQALVNDSVGNRRMLAWLLGVFAGVAMLLGAIGVYGVTAYAVSRRTNEIGIRIALGASSASVRRKVFGDALPLAGLGVVVGLGGAMLLGRFLQGFVVGVSTNDVATLLGVTVVMGLVAVAAVHFPARRATLISPVEALRDG